MKATFLNYATVLGIFFAFIQQAMVAGSIVIIAKLTQSVAAGSDFILWLCLFAASLTLVYVPTAFVNYFFNKAKYITFEGYVALFSQRTAGRVEHFLSAASSEEKEAYFTHEAWLVIDEDYEFLKNMAHLVFNIILSVAVLSYLISTALLAAYALAVPLTFVCIAALKKPIEKRSDAAQISRSRLMQTLTSGWDTILIGNLHNLAVWKTHFCARSAAADKAKRGQDLMLDFAAFGMVIISAAPVLIVIAQSFFAAVGNIPLLTLLVATIPRQLSTIQYLSDAISLFVNLSDKVRRTRQLSVSLSLENASAAVGKITWKSIRLAAQGRECVLDCFEDLRKYTDGYANGRYTITGDNGSGKTTILGKAKQELKERACFLPNKSKMLFENDLGQKEFSAGEKLAANLQEILPNLQADSVTVLLLDEWSANLDAANIKRIDKLIQNASEHFCIIEVVHRLSH